MSSKKKAVASKLRKTSPTKTSKSKSSKSTTSAHEHSFTKTSKSMGGGGGTKIGKSTMSRTGKSTGLKPSWRNESFINVVTPTEGDGIVRSVREDGKDDKDDPYQYMQPLQKKETILYRRLFFSNVVLTLVVILVWLLFALLFVNFFFFNTERYYVPRAPDAVPNLQRECQKRVSEQYKEIHGNCIYHIGRYPSDCKTLHCGHVFVIAEESAAADIGFVTFKTMPNQTFQYPMPDFAPCSTTGWCYKGQCMTVGDDARLKRYANESVQPIDGTWYKTECADSTCLLWFPIKKHMWPLYTSYPNGQCKGVECKLISTTNYRFFPTVQPNFGFHRCDIPAYGGKVRCWDNDVTNDEQELQSVIFLYDKCQCPKSDDPNQESALKDNNVQLLGDRCEIKGVSETCRMTCYQKQNGTEVQLEHQMPIGAACNKTNPTGGEPDKGFCFYGRCVTALDGEIKNCSAVEQEMFPDV